MTTQNTHQEQMITMSQAQLQELIAAQIDKATQAAVQETIARFTKEQEEAKQPAAKKAPAKKKASTSTKKDSAPKKAPKDEAINEAAGDLYDELTAKEEELKEEALKASKAKDYTRFDKLMALHKEVVAKRMALINKHSKSIFNEERTAKTRESVAKALRGTADTTHSINSTIINATQNLLIKTTDLLAGTIKSSVNIVADVANGANDLGKEVVYKVADAVDVKKQG